MAIPNRILEEIKNSEKDAKDFYSIYGKENIDIALENLKKSDEEILNKYSVENMKAKVAAKLNANKNGSKSCESKSVSQNILKFPAHKIISYAAAAVFLAAILIPAGMMSSNTEKMQPNSRPIINTKGNAIQANTEPEIKLYRQQGREVQALNNGDLAHSGDVIQITYNAGAQEFGVIFSVDGNGNVTRHFPENSWQAERLIHRNDETPLDFSYELDNAPNFECFILVTSMKEFSLDGIENQIKNKTDIDYLKELSYLPKKTDGVTFVLEK